MTTYQTNVTYDELIYKIGSYHYNWHPEIELLWLLSGEVEANVDGYFTNLLPNDLLLINSNCGHATFAKSTDSIMLRIHIDPNIFLLNGLSDYDRFSLNSSNAHINPLYESIRSSLANLTFAKNKLEQTKSYFDLLDLISKFYIVNDDNQSFSPTPRHQDAMLKLTEYLEQHFSEDISLPQLAKQVNYSTTYLSKLLKSQLGITYSEYIIRCRLQQVIRELTHSNDHISSIAYQVGFRNLKVFNQNFKSHFGMTPSSYRQQLTPQLVHSDSEFKHSLSDENKKLVKKIIQDHLNSEKNYSPCSTCEFREYEQKYHSLKNELQTFVRKH